MVTELIKHGDNDFELKTDGGLVFRSKVVVIAAGGGSFQPKKLPFLALIRTRGRPSSTP